MLRDIVKEFESIVWHDSKFLGFSASRSGTYLDRVKIDLMLCDRDAPVGQYRVAKLEFLRCAAFKCSLDFDALTEISFDLATGWCSTRSEWLQRLVLDTDPSAENISLYHFHLQMIAPGGDIDCVACDFHLQLGELALWY